MKKEDIYKGANPNNYITFSEETWRIMSVENDGTIKIIRNEALGPQAWNNSTSCNNTMNSKIIIDPDEGLPTNQWTCPATINTYLNEEYLQTLSQNNKIVSHNWGVGAITNYNNNLDDQINDENRTIWNGKVGLMTVSEYLRANTNAEKCKTFSLNNDNSTCKTTNYLYNIIPSRHYLGTISADTSSYYYIFFVEDGYIRSYSASLGDIFFAPTLYLSPDIKLSGEGTETNPYVIS